jgi:glucan phosphoethanolaminetransferase (alkaline phosphatase superfamily)
LMGLIALVVLFVSSYFAVRVYFNYDLPSQSDTFLKTEIGGWLVLIAINLIVTPFYVIYTLLISNTFFDTKTIELIFNQSTTDSHLWSMLVIFELMYNVFIIVLLVLLLVLFFRRRTILPRLIMAYYALSFVVNVVDYILARQILNTGLENTDSGKTMVQSFIIAAIWIPYFLYSNRVKRTFIVTLNPIKINQDNNTFPQNLSENSLETEVLPVENSDPIQTPDLLKDIPLNDR